MKRHSTKVSSRVPQSGAKPKPRTAAQHANKRKFLYRVKGSQNYLPKEKR